MDRFTLEEILEAAYLAGFEMVRNRETQLKGILILVDVSTFSFKHARQVTLPLIRKFVDIILVIIIRDN
jgi:hypothetical protein